MTEDVGVEFAVWVFNLIGTMFSIPPTKSCWNGERVRRQPKIMSLWPVRRDIVRAREVVKSVDGAPDADGGKSGVLVEEDKIFDAAEMVVVAGVGAKGAVVSSPSPEEFDVDVVGR